MFNRTYVNGMIFGRHNIGVFGFLGESGQIDMAAEVTVDGWSKVGFIGSANDLGVMFNIYIKISVFYSQNYASGFIGLLENTEMAYMNVYGPVFKVTLKMAGTPSGLIYGCVRDSDTNECTSYDIIAGGAVNLC